MSRAFDRLRAGRGHARNAALAAATVLHGLREDPLHFGLQVARRWSWAPVRGAAVRLARSGRPTARALAAWLEERPEEAVQEILRSGARSRLAGELVVQAGRADLLDQVLPQAPAALRARAAHARGELSAAVAVAPPVLRRRYAAELATLRGEAVPVAARDARPSGARATATGPAGTGPRVVHVLTNSVPHTQSGYALRSHAVLAAQRAAGIDACAVTRLGYPVSVGRLGAHDVDVVDGVTYRRLLPGRMPRTLPERLQEQVDRMVPLLDAWRPDLVHSTTEFTNGLVAQALAQSRGLPWVHEVRGLLEETWLARQPAETREEAARSERYRLWKTREAAVACAASHVVTLGRSMAAELMRRGVRADRISVVPNGVDESLLHATTPSATARERLGLPVAGFWVGTVSSLVAYEGIDVLLEAVARLRASGVDARVLVVGDGVARPALQHRAEALGLGPAAVFTGRVAPALAPRYHQALDVFAVPRQDTPVCRLVTPLKPVEAMAVGRPVVASDLPALAEVVAEPGTGVLAPAGDVDAWCEALATLAADADRRAALAAAGRAFASGRTWQQAGRTYQDLYRRLAEAA